jgi:hypothetical protein
VLEPISSLGSECNINTEDHPKISFYAYQNIHFINEKSVVYLYGLCIDIFSSLGVMTFVQAFKNQKKVGLHLRS